MAHDGDPPFYHQPRDEGCIPMLAVHGEFKAANLNHLVFLCSEFFGSLGYFFLRQYRGTTEIELARIPS